MSRFRSVKSRRGLQTAWWACLASVASSVAAAGLVNSSVAGETSANTQARSHAEAQFAEGVRLAAAGKLAAATEVFARMTTDYPRLSEPYAQLAALYVRQGQPAKAIAPLQRALSLETDKAAVQEQLGDLYVALAAEAYAAAAPTRTSARAKAAALPVDENDHSSTGSGQ